MSGPVTSRDMQRVIFAESLHKSLKEQDAKLLKDRQRFASVASSYLDDGLTEAECVELLMIDGLARESAEGYTTMALSGDVIRTASSNDEASVEYSFRFQDSYGDVWSSCEVGRIISATSNEDAWNKAQQALDDDKNLEGEKILSVNKIND